MSVKLELKFKRANLTERRKSEMGRTFVEVATEEGKVSLTTKTSVFEPIPLLTPISIEIPVEIEQWGDSQMLTVHETVNFDVVK